MTTTDSNTIAIPALTITALIHTSANGNLTIFKSTSQGKKIINSTTTKAIATVFHLTRPEPSAGFFSETVPRTGIEFPRITKTTMITANGTAFSRPRTALKRWLNCTRVSISIKAMKIAPTNVNGNDSKPPINAQANAGTTSNINCVGPNGPCVAAIKIPEPAASAEPNIQFAPAIRFGDQPSVAAATSFSATADVARPTVVER